MENTQSVAMRLLDSSVWIEYFANGQYADVYEAAIRDVDHLLVWPINLCEVFRRVMQQRNEHEAYLAVAVMLDGRMLDIDGLLALEAVLLAQQYRLPLADSILLATARAHDAQLITQDAHFRDIPGVLYYPKNEPEG
jgi:predicted nucleic acid-binding protein